MPAFVLLVRPRGDDDPAMGVGFTVTKKIGGAVVRNRIKRRFRALAREVMPEAGVAGADHVLIGRNGADERDYADLKAELLKALRKCSGEGRSAVYQVPPPALQGSGLRRSTGGNEGAQQQ
ncbi:ribonuclease P protein component [Sphingomonas vulcanisoli]|uniref:Ribonuclease P protein component n=1 Tax=Sphingomonas vulcanisoli TaxID=1658060 RepID=A0ABX0TLP7_9SPHN|nr:ribonuclease P protein component [Sphingomonas vulcanisoli]